MIIVTIVYSSVVLCLLNIILLKVMSVEIILGLKIFPFIVLLLFAIERCNQ